MKNMKITYIGHSGYLVELADCYCLFDYYEGSLPGLDKKPLFVFVSHQHQDHYNPWIFSLAERQKELCFVLSADIKANPGKLPVFDREQCIRFREEGKGKLCDGEPPIWIYRVRARQTYEFAAGNVTLQIHTLRSTDAGVAYLVRHEGRMIFHAGDLNWWHQEGADKQFNNNMAANYKREIAMLAELSGGAAIDTAFLPIDPHIGEAYWYGYDYFLRTVPVKHVFPMHFWGDTGVVTSFLERYDGKPFWMKNGQEITIHQPPAAGESAEVI